MKDVSGIQPKHSFSGEEKLSACVKSIVHMWFWQQPGHS